jgi:hypothetical protein
MVEELVAIPPRDDYVGTSLEAGKQQAQDQAVEGTTK